jgi:hypothetical protein
VSAAAKLLGDKAYGSAELREWLSERNTNPVVPHRSNRKTAFISVFPVAATGWWI